MDIQQYIASGIIESYVMGLCTTDEERELERLRLQYPELNKAVTACEMQMEEKLMQQVALPGDEVDKKIITLFEAMNKPVSGTVSIKPKRNSWLKPLSIAASVLLLISAGYNYYLYKQNKEIVAKGSVTLPVGDYKIMNDPSITPVAMYGVIPHSICRCTMFWDKKTGKMYIMIHHLPLSSGTQDYQLWAMVDGRPVSVGIVRDEIRGRFIEMSNVPAGATGFSITLEKAGGSTSPTVEETYVRGVI